MRCCISFDSYIKPQHIATTIRIATVVYLLIPTSNHNLLATNKQIIKLYIFWFLHQTTTMIDNSNFRSRCISFDSYIKPQLHRNKQRDDGSCISFDSYIKPQLFGVLFSLHLVVYLLIPTSNHNSHPSAFLTSALYIFWFLHQTTTMKYFTSSVKRCISFDSYIKPQPNGLFSSLCECCISFDSYIKPQL